MPATEPDSDDPARRAEKIIILDRGNVEFGYPGDWTVTPDPAGFVKLPPLPPDAPRWRSGCGTRLPRRRRLVRSPPIVSVERTDMQLAWAEYRYECDDADRGERRRARGRWLIAANRYFQALLTYYCCRILSFLILGAVLLGASFTLCAPLSSETEIVFSLRQTLPSAHVFDAGSIAYRL